MLTMRTTLWTLNDNFYEVYRLHMAFLVRAFNSCGVNKTQSRVRLNVYLDGMSLVRVGD